MLNGRFRWMRPGAVRWDSCVVAAFPAVLSLVMAGCMAVLAGCAAGRGDVAVAGGPGSAAGGFDQGVVVAENLPGALSGEIDDVLRRVVATRGLRPVGPITARGVSREEQVEYVKAEAEKPENIRPLKIVESLLKATGSIGKDVDLVERVSDFMVNDIAGYYDWDRRVLFVGDWGEIVSMQDVLAHELTHALQDQHFGLARLAEPVDGISEPFGAGLALVEGDATLAMALVGAGDVGFDTAMFDVMANVMDSVWDQESAKAVNPLPKVVSELLKFPYVTGVRYVGWLLGGGADGTGADGTGAGGNGAGGNGAGGAAGGNGAGGGGWAAVDDALRTPPLSCEQVMHPGAPGGSDLPRNVRLPRTTVAGGVFEGTDIVGESGFQAIFRDVMPRADADAAAAGWDGDRYAAWSMPGGGRALVLLSVWDSAVDAREAGMALSRLRVTPEGLSVRGEVLAAVWGIPSADAGQLSAALAEKPDTVEIATWADWLAEGRLIGAGPDGP